MARYQTMDAKTLAEGVKFDRRGAAAPARLTVPRAATLDENLADGTVIAGTPDTVVAAIERQAAVLGINYLLAYLFFGEMSLAQALRSLALFRREVMPRIASL